MRNGQTQENKDAKNEYALLMRANKPKMAVQSSGPFLLAPHGLFIIGKERVIATFHTQP